MTEDEFNNFYSGLIESMIELLGPVFEDPSSNEIYEELLVPVNISKTFGAFYNKTFSCIQNSDLMTEEEIFQSLQHNLEWFLSKLKDIILNINAVIQKDYEEYVDY